MISSTLIIVPRGPVYVQWERTLQEQTDLKYLAIDNLNFINKCMPKYRGDDNEIINYFNVLCIKTAVDYSIAVFFNI